MRMPCVDYTYADLQNAFYKGCTHNVEGTNLVVWNLFGEIIHAVINFSWLLSQQQTGQCLRSVVSRTSGQHDAPLRAILEESAFIEDIIHTKGKIVGGRTSNERK